MAFCKKCGNELDNDAKFCSSCGIAIGKKEDIIEKQAIEENKNEGKMSSFKLSMGNGKREKKKTHPFTSFLTIGILIFLAILTYNISNSDTPTETVEKTPEEKRSDMISDGFSSWDGSHIALTRMIKESMNDPKSFDHVDTKYWDMKDHLIVIEKFRGKNAFGGTVINWVKAKCDLNGNVIKIIEQGQ